MCLISAISASSTRSYSASSKVLTRTRTEYGVHGDPLGRRRVTVYVHGIPYWRIHLGKRNRIPLSCAAR